MRTIEQPGDLELALPSAPLLGRKAKPVKWFALIGALCVVAWAYLWTRWIGAGQFKATPHGPTPIPDYVEISLRLTEAAVVILFVVCTYLWLVRPWRREHRLTLDGMFFIALTASFWIDPLDAYVRPWYLYNTGFLQFGSWLDFVPGVKQPNANLINEPWIQAGLSYAPFVLGGMMLGCVVMRWAKARWPQLGTFGLIMICFAGMFATDMVFENVALGLRWFSYPGTVGPTLHIAHWQLPLLEVVAWAGTWTALSALRYFRDDKGRTVVERGIDQVRATPGQKTWLRLLAIYGICVVLLIGFYYGPVAFLASQTGQWDKKITKESYLMNGVCGPGTTFACPGPAIPIPQGNGSAYIGPDGQVVVPDGTNLPGSG